ncbi:hypothetical protein [Alcaligenes aquatilis]|uniref:hypothetical protein n=1 Tax=Alcaligenes aquatilis TaxID=323284 RepID=UPI003F92F2D0
MSTKASTKAKRGKDGICSLTGKHGKFVKAHILPRALTRLSRTGEKARETELGGKPKNRPPTWYDDELVIREGEDILEEIDTPAIDTMRNHILVWSSFVSDEPFSPEALMFVCDAFSIRDIRIGSADADKLRLFFLSIVWRAAASRRSEFKHVQLGAEELEDIRQRVLTRTPGSAWEYPIILDQIVTRGVEHNRTPIKECFDLPGGDEGSRVSVPSIRIYMDGLVAHVLLTKDEDVAQGLGGLCLGARGSTGVMARSFEKSRTYDDMREVILDNIVRGHG